jgi:N utilization substance protein A
VIEIKNIVREPGFRTKIAVSSNDPKVDCVGACVGVRGSRIKNIVDELNGEKIDIIQWDDVPERLICNTLKPAEIASIILDEEEKKATVIVGDDQVSLAIGRRGQNVRLASKLSGWNIDITTQSRIEEKEKAAKAAAGAAEAPEGATAEPVQAPSATGLEELLEGLAIPQDGLVDLLAKIGVKTVEDLAQANAEELGAIEGIGPDKAKEFIALAQKQAGGKSG